MWPTFDLDVELLYSEIVGVRSVGKLAQINTAKL